MIKPVANDGIQWLETRYTIIFSDFDKMQEHVPIRIQKMVLLRMSCSSVYKHRIEAYKHSETAHTNTEWEYLLRTKPYFWESCIYGNYSN